MTSVTLKRILPAPSSDVYRAWLAPEILVRWAAPIEYDAARVEVDERVGGHYRCWHVDADGRDVGGFECEIPRTRAQRTYRAEVGLRWA